MAGEQLTLFDVEFEDVDVDWRDVARMFAEQLARTVEFQETLERLEHDASYRMRRAFKDDDYDDGHNWETPYAAATMLRDVDEERPELRDKREYALALRDLREVQRTEAEAERADSVALVLVSPRQRQNVIERIVLTGGGRVSAEYLHETGWRRYKTDLRTILSGAPLPRSTADAISRVHGVYDALPTEECLKQMREMDPDCIISGPSSAAALGGAVAVPYQYKKLDDVAHAHMRITEAEVLDDSRAYDARFGGSDVTNAALAAEMFRTTPAIWSSVTLWVDAPAPGPLDVRVCNTFDAQDVVPASARLRQLVARRYEAAEENQKRAWKRFVFTVTRAVTPEWTCDLRYEFVLAA